VSVFDGITLDFFVPGYFGATHRAGTGAAHKRRTALAALAFQLKTDTL